MNNDFKFSFSRMNNLVTNSSGQEGGAVGLENLLQT
jgi:hypothetical protein